MMVLFTNSWLEKPINETITLAIIRPMVTGIAEKSIMIILSKLREKQEVGTFGNYYER
jgi:hypothetical protein